MIIKIAVICAILALFAIASYALITYAKHLPSAKGTKVLLKTKSEVESESSFMKLITKLSNKVKLSPYNKKKLSNALEISEIRVTPEIYILKSFFLGLASSILGSSLFIVHPLGGLVGIVLGPVMGYVTYSEVFNKFKKHKAQVEREVPRFTQSVAENLKITRDVVVMLTAYKSIANKAFRFEIEKTLADMKTSNYESALLRFDARIDSVYLSETIRGLIGCLRGNDERNHFESLSTNMKNVERNIILKEVNKRPRKMHSLSMVMLFSAIILYGVVFGTVLMEALSGANF